MALDSPTTASIKFKHMTGSRLEYHVNSTGLNLRHVRIQRAGHLEITVINSRGNQTPGWISIPSEDLDTLIQDLIQLNNNIKAIEHV